MPDHIFSLFLLEKFVNVRLGQNDSSLFRVIVTVICFLFCYSPVMQMPTVYFKKPKHLSYHNKGRVLPPTRASSSTDRRRL